MKVFKCKMGLFDFVRGGGFKPADVGFDELESWLEGRREEEHERILKESSGLIKDVRECVGELESAVGDFDSMRLPEEIWERAEKIIRPSKPDYVRAMVHTRK